MKIGLKEAMGIETLPTDSREALYLIRRLHDGEDKLAAAVTASGATSVRVKGQQFHPSVFVGMVTLEAVEIEREIYAAAGLA